MTSKKQRACCKNLKKARETLRLNRLRIAAGAAYTTLQPYRQQERAMIEEAVAKSRAELKTLESLIRQDPKLS